MLHANNQSDLLLRALTAHCPDLLRRLNRDDQVPESPALPDVFGGTRSTRLLAWDQCIHGAALDQEVRTAIAFWH